MDIHHSLMVRNSPDRLFEALTQQRDFEVWMGATTCARLEVGSALEFHFDQGQRILKMEVTRLERGNKSNGGWSSPSGRSTRLTRSSPGR
jgi:uncharacterized protein YndB with AHSA1/START domain